MHSVYQLFKHGLGCKVKHKENANKSKRISAKINLSFLKISLCINIFRLVGILLMFDITSKTMFCTIQQDVEIET